MGLRSLLQIVLYFLHTLSKNSSYFNSWNFEGSLQAPTPNSRSMRAGVAQGGIIFPCPIEAVCQRHAFAFPPRRVSSLRRRYGRHSHVPLASAARQIPGDVPVP